MKPAVPSFRERVVPGDVHTVRRLAAATGFFTKAEVGVAVELVEERLAKGQKSGYRFLFAEGPGAVLGYTCFGEIPCTVGAYDLYWIVVDPEAQGRGIGRALIERTEDIVRRLQGRRIYIETASRDLYAPTQGFYTAAGYALEARLEDFYGPGDDKLIYCKVLALP